MSERPDRRTFLRHVAFTSGAVVGGGSLCQNKSLGVEPIQREGGPKYKFTLAGYSYRKLLTGDPPEMSLEEFVRDCARFGLEGTEPTSYYFPKHIQNPYCS